MKHLFQYLALSGLLLLFYACAEKIESKSADNPPVKNPPVSTSILATGIIKSKTGAEVRVGSSVSGVVKKLFVKTGSSIKKGELLAKIDDSELFARYNLAIANLENSQTVLKYAKIELERARPLAEKHITSAQAFDELVKASDIATSVYASSKASVDYAETELNFTKIIAPISGVIGSVSTQEGETVSAAFSSPTFVTIIDLSKIEVWTYVDETDIGKVVAGQKATFTVDTYAGITFSGSVSTIYPKAEIRDNVVNYIVIIEISDLKGKILRPEMTASVTIDQTK